MKKTWRWIVLLLLLASTLACSITVGGGGNPVSPTPILRGEPEGTPTVTVRLPLVVGGGASTEQGSIVAVYDQVSPGVVSIQVATDQGIGQGSGFVFDKEGHIVTNYHVVDGATAVEVDFPSGTKVYGQVIGTDLDSDMAVIKVEVSVDELKPLALGDANKLKVGQTVVAIGNPYGYSGTMTVGIISAMGRTLDSLRQSPEGNFYSAGDIIQTDAAINPGNSGGPLLNLDGEVIGINRAIFAPSTGLTGQPTSSGIGFAISVNIVRRVVPVLIKTGKFDYPYLGISSLPEISLRVKDALNLPRANGAYVTNVVKGGPGDKAGLRAGTQPSSIQSLNGGGDLIIAVDDQPVLIFGDLLRYLMDNKSPGDTVTLTIIRDGQEKEVPITLGKRP